MPNWRNMGWRGTSLWRFYLKDNYIIKRLICHSESCLKKMLANEQIVHDVCNNVWWARQYNLLLYYGLLIWQQVGKKPDITYLFHVNYCPNCVNVSSLYSHIYSLPLRISRFYIFPLCVQKRIVCRIVQTE